MCKNLQSQVISLSFEVRVCCNPAVQSIIAAGAGEEVKPSLTRQEEESCVAKPEMQSSVASQTLTWLTALWAEGFLLILQVRMDVEKLKGQKAAKIVGDEELVGEDVAKDNLIEMSVKSNWVLPTTWKQTLLSGSRQCNKGQWLETITWKYRWDTSEGFSWEDCNPGKCAWTPCEISVLWEFEDC